MNTSRTSIFCLSLLAACASVGTAAGQESDVPATVSMHSTSSNYNYPGIDWGALGDPRNDGLLRACVRGATRSDLTRLGLTDLQERLTTLEKGKLIQQRDGELAP